MKATYHLIDIVQSHRTGQWIIELVERTYHRGGWFWLKQKTRDQRWRCFGTPDKWRTDMNFDVHEDSPMSKFCNQCVSFSESAAMIRAREGFAP